MSLGAALSVHSGIYKIFVYGTLMEAFLADVLPGKMIQLGERSGGKINACLFDLGEYPGAVATTIHIKQVRGEIYEIGVKDIQWVLHLFDEYEGYLPADEDGSLFIRRPTTVVKDNEQTMIAWVYWYNRPIIGKPEIVSGDYKKYLKRNK